MHVCSKLVVQLIYRNLLLVDDLNFVNFPQAAVQTDIATRNDAFMMLKRLSPACAKKNGWLRSESQQCK